MLNATSRKLTTWALGLVALIAAGAFFHSRDAAQRRQMEAVTSELRDLRGALNEPAPAPSPSFPPSTSLAAPPIDTDALATKVAAKLRADGAPAAVAPRAAAAEATEATREGQLAAARASQVLDGALADGRLSREDVIAMRKELAEGGRAEDARELSRKIAVALNTNQLVPEDPQFVFP